MKTIQFQGKALEVIELDTLSENEHWNEYQLSDGAVLSIKLVVRKIFKAVNEKNEEGDPLYVAQSQNIMKVKGTD